MAHGRSGCLHLSSALQRHGWKRPCPPYLERRTEATVYQRSLSMGALNFLWGKVEKMNQQIAAQIKESLTEGKLPCPAAFKLARRLEVSPEQVGEVADEFSIRISRCQLGLFGYWPEGKPLEPAPEVGRQLEVRIRDRVIEEGLPCATAWDIASELTMKRIDVARAAESLGVRVTQCQLGCFD